MKGLVAVGETIEVRQSDEYTARATQYEVLATGAPGLRLRRVRTTLGTWSRTPLKFEYGPWTPLKGEVFMTWRKLGEFRIVET